MGALAVAAILILASGCASRMDRLLDMGENVFPFEVPGTTAQLSAVALDESEQLGVRAAAIRSLSMLPSAASVRTLARLAEWGNSPDIRTWAVWALGETGLAEAVPPLVEALSDRPGLRVCQYALEALVKLMPQVAADPQLRLQTLLGINSAEARFSDSSEVLGLAGLLRENLGNLRDFAAVLRNALDGGDVRETYNALNWAGALALDQAAEADPREMANVTSALADVARHPERALRLKAIWFLGMIGRPSEASLLLGIAKEDGDRSARLLAVWALGRADRRMLARAFRPMPAELLAGDPARWKEAHEMAAASGEPDLEVQRLIADLLQGGQTR
jgi:HEAT repeat protein